MIVDDHAFLRAGVEQLLSKRGMEISLSTGDGDEALSEIPERVPDVILLDVRMPRVNGVQFLREFRRRGHGCGVVVLATDIDDCELAALVEDQVDAILYKSCSDEELLSTLETVARGKTSLDRNLLVRARNVRSRNGQLRQAQLSPREREVVELIQRGLKNEEIADRLGIKVGSVKVHVHNVLAKTGAENRGALRSIKG